MDRSSPDGWTGLAYTVLQLPSSEDTGFRQFLGTLLPSFVPLHQGCCLKSKGGPCTWMDIGHSESCTQGNFKSFLKAAVKSPVKLHFLVPYQAVHQTATALRLVLCLQRCSKPWPGCRQSLHSLYLFWLPTSSFQLHFPNSMELLSSPSWTHTYPLCTCAISIHSYRKEYMSTGGCMS